MLSVPLSVMRNGVDQTAPRRDAVPIVPAALRDAARH
jgi:hypothetical protein